MTDPDRSPLQAGGWSWSWLPEEAHEPDAWRRRFDAASAAGDLPAMSEIVHELREEILRLRLDGQLGTLDELREELTDLRVAGQLRELLADLGQDGPDPPESSEP